MGNIVISVNKRPLLALSSRTFGLQGPIYSDYINYEKHVNSDYYHDLVTEDINPYELTLSAIYGGYDHLCYIGSEVLTPSGHFTMPSRYYWWMDTEDSLKDFFQEVSVPEEVFIETDFDVESGYRSYYRGYCSYYHGYDNNYIMDYVQWFLISYSWGKYMEQYFETDPSKQGSSLQVPEISYEDWYETWIGEKNFEEDSDSVLKEYACKHKDICSGYIWGKYYIEEYFETDPDLY